MIPRGSQDRVNAIRDGLEKMFEELLRHLAIRLVHELDDGKLTGPINAHKEIELAFHRLNLGDVRSRACKHALSGSG